jgi:hypothetical protein
MHDLEKNKGNMLVNMKGALLSSLTSVLIHPPEAFLGSG